MPCTWNSQSVTHMSNNDCETRKFKFLTLDNVLALPIKYSIRACNTSDSELEHMNAEYMMHGFLHVPNASASRAAHVNLKHSQGACFNIGSLRSSTLEYQSKILF